VCNGICCGAVQRVLIRYGLLEGEVDRAGQPLFHLQLAEDHGTKFFKWSFHIQFSFSIPAIKDRWQSTVNKKSEKRDKKSEKFMKIRKIFQKSDKNLKFQLENKKK
jgi:hypothetical protein